MAVTVGFVVELSVLTGFLSPGLRNVAETEFLLSLTISSALVSLAEFADNIFEMLFKIEDML